MINLDAILEMLWMLFGGLPREKNDIDIVRSTIEVFLKNSHREMFLWSLKNHGHKDFHQMNEKEEY